MPWTINSTPLAALNHGDAKLNVRSQGIDEFLVAKSGACDVSSIESGTWCELKNPDGAVVFQGEAVLTQGEAEGASEKNLLRILGPWSDLEGITWRDGTDLRLNFPDDSESTEPVALADAVESVLTQAIALGARFTIGTITLSGEMPAAQYDNATCAAILVAILRWSPGAGVFFNYNTGGLPAIHVIAAASLATHSLAAAGCLGLRVAPRTDFQVAGVRLVYRKKISSTYGEAEGIEVDSAGTPDELGGLVMAIDLNPARAQYSLQKNRLTVGLVNPSSGDWWRTLGVTSTGDPVSSSSSGDTDLDYYVTAGNLQNWMLEEINGVANTDPYGCSGPLTASPGEPPTGAEALAGTPPELHIENDQQYRLGKRRFEATFDDGKTWTIELPVTNLSASGAYYRETLAAWDEGEPVPDGLAAAFYAGASRLAYQGSFSVVGQECLPLTHRPGKALNITGTAWSAMGAPIYAVSHDIATGKSSIEFGPANHLGAADLLELYRANRGKKATQPALEPEEEPEQVSYAAVAASASEPPASGETGTLVIAINSFVEVDFDEADAPWIAVGPKTYNGKGPGSTPVEPGTYTVQFLPIQKVDSGLWFVSESIPVVTIGPSGGDTATGTYDAVQRLFVKASNQTNPTGFDLNAQDIIDLGLPTAGALLLKARVLDVCHMGAPGKRVFLCGESYTEEE